MKKKMISSALALLLTGAIVLPVHAADTNVSVTYREPNAYTLTIPASVELSSDAQVSNEISVADVNLEPGKKIEIKITNGIVDNAGTIELSRAQDHSTKAVTTVSTHNFDSGIPANTVFATFTANGTQTLSFSAVSAKTGGMVKAGSYSGTIAFTVDAPNKN